MNSNISQLVSHGYLVDPVLLPLGRFLKTVIPQESLVCTFSRLSV